MKKLLAVILTSVLIAGMLIGCGGKGTDKPAAGGGSDAKEDVVLKVVWFGDGDEGQSFMRLAAKYEEENPNIKVELIEVPFNELESRLRTMINGGEIPAMARLNYLGPYKNQLIDLGDYVSDREDFINSFGEGLKFVFDGKVLGAPNDVTANGLIYNKTLFDQAGVSVPGSPEEIWTWDEWKEAMQKVVDNSDAQYGLVFDKTTQRFSTLLYQAGGGFLSKDLSESAIDTPENRRAVEFFVDLHNSGLVPRSIWLGAEDANSMFRTGQVAMHLGGSWLINNYRDDIKDFEWGVTYMPKEARRSTVPGGKWLSAFQGSGVEAEAAAFIEWLSKPEINAIYCQENYFISQVIGNEQLDYDFGSEFFAIFNDELAATSERPGNEWGFPEFTGQINVDFRDQLSEVIAGNITVDEYMKNMTELFTETLNSIE